MIEQSNQGNQSSEKIDKKTFGLNKLKNKKIIIIIRINTTLMNKLESV